MSPMNSFMLAHKHQTWYVCYIICVRLVS